jgi:hypothetical protein
MVISLLEREEVSELGVQREAELCRANGLEFVSFPIPDRRDPLPGRDWPIIRYRGLCADLRRDRGR